MLILRRNERQWVQIQHQDSGDVIRVQIRELRRGAGEVILAFEDDRFRFNVDREERLHKDASA